ncbi:hypothetical protein [Tenacibaculum maritimum]|uniref:hypothetical protein n=1 Tax=Tenacibaculum maritimum TaxID=107401 RepID=UPI0012E4BA56|nr:hypothetical protein [Tenacibaculum maritimum]CAA0254747.1 conserved hypothetical protein [Tenacibaculum maritimum]
MKGFTGYYKYGALFGNNKQQKYIRSLCYQLGWVKPHDTWGKVPDNERLGKFVFLDCKHKIPLSKQTPEQLQVTIYQLEQVLVK